MYWFCNADGETIVNPMPNLNTNHLNDQYCRVPAIAGPENHNNDAIRIKCLMLSRAIFLVSSLCLSATSFAMVALEEDEMSEVSGAGLALGLQDIRIQASPTTYLEMLGTNPPGGSVLDRGDFRFYGFALSGTTPTATWFGLCGVGYAGMGCPIGDTIDLLSPFDNPLLIRVQSYNGINHLGVNSSQTVFEWLGPTSMDPYRYAYWGELVVGSNVTGTANRLQGQVIMNDAKLISRVNGADRNAKIRIVKHTDPGDQTVGFIWHNHWQGDFRFSTAQDFFSPDAFGAPPSFNQREGFYALNIQTYVPLGHMFYQDIILDDVGGTGNFRVELTRPNGSSAAVYNDFYSIAGANGYQRAGRSNRYYETHGYFRIGDWTPPCPGGSTNCLAPAAGGVKNGIADTNDGIFFASWDPVAASAQFNAFSSRPDTSNVDTGSIGTLNNTNNGNRNIVNLGDGRIEGMLFQHFELRTLGVN